MNKEFIPYEEAAALKELGFDEKCLFSWVETMKGWKLDVGQWKDISAPLYQQAFRWFREKHNLTTHIKWNVGGVWDYTVEKSVPRGMLDMSPSRYMVGLETYEQAELTCLRKLIEIVKNKENENNNQ